MSDQTIAGLTPAGSTGNVLHLLAKGSNDCPSCGAPPSEHEVRDYNEVMHDGDVHCKRCGTFVRFYDAG